MKLLRTKIENPVPEITDTTVIGAPIYRGGVGPRHEVIDLYEADERRQLEIQSQWRLETEAFFDRLAQQRPSYLRGVFDGLLEVIKNSIAIVALLGTILFLCILCSVFGAPFG